RICQPDLGGARRHLRVLFFRQESLPVSRPVSASAFPGLHPLPGGSCPCRVFRRGPLGDRWVQAACCETPHSARDLYRQLSLDAFSPKSEALTLAAGTYEFPSSVRSLCRCGETSSFHPHVQLRAPDSQGSGAADE